MKFLTSKYAQYTGILVHSQKLLVSDYDKSSLLKIYIEFLPLPRIDVPGAYNSQLLNLTLNQVFRGLIVLNF